jgi:hypothetical protein
MRVRPQSLALLAALSAVLCAVPTPAAAQSAAKSQDQPVPRLPNGKPDLSGVWDHPRVGDLTKDVTGKCSGETPGCKSTGAGELPFTALGLAEFKKENKFDYGVHCLPWGYVRSWGTPYPLEFVQNSQRLAILFEQNNMFHVVPTDGRDHPKDLDSTWLGNSVGKWDGDTLVIDTIGFNAKTWLDTAEHPLSESLHVIERISRPDYRHLNYEITIEDPQMYTKPFKNSRVFVLMKPGQEIMEYSCDENNKEIVEGHVTDSWTHK